MITFFVFVIITHVTLKRDERITKYSIFPFLCRKKIPRRSYQNHEMTRIAATIRRTSNINIHRLLHNFLALSTTNTSTCRTSLLFYVQSNIRHCCVSTISSLSKQKIEETIPGQVTITCLPGLEKVLLQELRFVLGNDNDNNNNTDDHSTILQTIDKKRKGQIIIPPNKITQTDLFKCCLYLGSATQIRWQCCDTFTARGLAELRRKVNTIVQWNTIFNKDDDLTKTMQKQKNYINVRVVSSKSKLYHTSAIQERILLGIYDSLGHNNNEEKIVNNQDETDIHSDAKSSSLSSLPEGKILLDVHIKNDQVSIFVNAFPTPLHQRGYRLQTAKAPLREDLAFAILISAGWTPSWWETSKQKQQQQPDTISGKVC